MFNYEVKFLTSDESLHLNNGDFKTYKYETKKKSEETVYDKGKRGFCESRGGKWRAYRQRQLKQLETKLRERSILFCEWSTENLVSVVLSSGAIAYITVKPHSLDIIQILFDRYCVGKLLGQNVTSAIMCKTHLMFITTDKTATLVTFGKSNSSQLCRISDRDPLVQNIELGGSSRRAERKVSWCEYSEGFRILVWSSISAEPAPWSPIVEDLANLHLYQINGPCVQLVAYHQLENETLSAELSHKNGHVIHIVEQFAVHKTGVSLEWTRYDIPYTEDKVLKLTSLRKTMTQMSLPAPARVIRRSQCDTRLITACIDGSIHIIHHEAGIIYSTRAGFIATDVRWTGDIIVALEEAGRLQCFDKALSLLHHHTKCIDLTSHLREGRRMQILASKTIHGGPVILCSFSGGPLALLRITHPRLLTVWIRSGRIQNAVALLRCLDWDADGTECLWAVNHLVCTALRSGLQTHTETAAQAALGAFLAPAASHSASAQRFAPPVHDLARKFFHHLLRRGRIEKAMSLAVDLADWDLFADARWAASRRNLHQLSEEAASLATHYASEYERDSSYSDSCSQCSSQSSLDSEEAAPAARTPAPPLPRVPIPQTPALLSVPAPPTLVPIPPTITLFPPTLLPLPIVQPESTSSNSIRPNLHQYLERDNTSWYTDAKDSNFNKHNNIKPILSNQPFKWHSMDVLNYKPKHLISINEDQRQDRHSRSLYQTELREDVPNTLYRYQLNFHNACGNDGRFKYNDVPDRVKSGERNKVKFSDTVTVAVMPEPRCPPCPSPTRELAESLPLCAPHKYLSAFAPHPSAASTSNGTLDYVEV